MGLKGGQEVKTRVIEELNYDPQARHLRRGVRKVCLINPCKFLLMKQSNKSLINLKTHLNISNKSIQIIKKCIEVKYLLGNPLEKGEFLYCSIPPLRFAPKSTGTALLDAEEDKLFF